LFKTYYPPKQGMVQYCRRVCDVRYLNSTHRDDARSPGYRMADKDKAVTPA